MKCPRDGSSLRQVVRTGTTVDVCAECHGRWLDQGELEALVLADTRTGATPAAIEAALDATEKPFFFPQEDADPALTCPRCGVAMQKVSFESGGAHVTADRCEGCKGIWLDAGEAGSLFVFLEEHLPIRRFVWAIVALIGLGLLAVYWLTSR